MVAKAIGIVVSLKNNIMKHSALYIACFLSLVIISGCEKKTNYPGGTVSPYIAIYDVRNLYKGKEVTLTKENMFGATKITGVVVSDHSGGNLPQGLLFVQDSRRLSQLRGIAIPIGDAAADYVTGDSVIIEVEGGVLKRVDGMLQLTNIHPGDITKVSSGNIIPRAEVKTRDILQDPEKFESTMLIIMEAVFDPLPDAGSVFAGNYVLNDSYGEIHLHTEPGAAFADMERPVLANYKGIIFNAIKDNGEVETQLRLRTADDVQLLSSVIEIAPIIITGFLPDPLGGDGNYEYIQFMATRDIDFSVTPFSVVTTNNAGASTPGGLPTNGWATGGLRTYKFNLTSGTADSGTFFYVGGSSKLICGAGSTDISSANWVKAYDYSQNNGDGFGTKTSNLLANSGNASGVAVFEGTDVTADSRPVDVIFVATGGTIYSPGPPEVGYRITNTDFYDVVHSGTLQPQPFFRSGSNQGSLGYPTGGSGQFMVLGGVYNPKLGRWASVRTQTNVFLTVNSTLAEIEGENATTLK